MTDTPVVFCGRTDRLGARLKNLLAAWQFAEATGARLVVNWSPTEEIEDVEFSFTTFFDRSIVDHPSFPILIDETPKSEALRRHSIDPDNVLPLRSGHSTNFFAETGLKSIVYPHTAQYLFSDAAGRSDILSRGMLFRRLPLHPAVAECVSRVTSGFNIRPAVAVHIRRGDIVLSMAGDSSIEGQPSSSLNGHVKTFATRYAPDGAYVAALNEIAPDGRVMFFSDDTGVRNRFLRQYGERAVDFFAEIDNSDLTSPQRAMVEMLVMSRVDAGIGTQSGFLQFAAELGGFPIHDAIRYIQFEELLVELETMTERRDDRAKIMQMLLATYAKAFAARGMRKQQLAAEHQLTRYLSKVV